MHRHKFVPSVVVAVLLLVVSLTAGAAPTEIVILHTNDLHARMAPIEVDGEERGGFARIAGLVEVIRALHPDRVLWLDAGDTTHGTNAANLFAGASVIEVLSAAGLDAMALGNHDFNYGHEVVPLRASEAAFPILSANTFYADSGIPFARNVAFFDRGGVKIAVFGMTTPDTPFVAHPRDVAGLRFHDPIEVAGPLVSLLRQLADVVIAVTHNGVDMDIATAKAVPGIDVIVGGHSHTPLFEPINVDGTLIVQANEYGKYLGFLKLVVDEGQIVDYEGRLIPITSNLPAQPLVQELVDAWEVRVGERLQVTIGRTETDLLGERADVRSRETNLGNLIADIMRESIDADIALMNGGNLRASIPAGDIALGDVYTVLPFDNTLAGLELTGADVLAALEHGLRLYPETNAAFLHVSGIRFVFDPSRPAGTRIVEATVGGRPLERDRVYRVATNDFLAAGGDEFTMFLDKPFFHGSPLGDGLFLLDVVAAYLEEHSPVAPEVDGRITPINN